MWNSFLLSSAAFILTWTLSIGVGAIAALRPYSWFDKITTMIVFIAISMPAFFLSILALKLFAVDMQLFPLSGMSSSGQNYSGVSYVVDILHHIALPAIVLAMIGMGGPSRYVRSDMIEIMLQDYIRTARAKGMNERTVVLKHALRNALIPILTLMSFDLSVLFSGALIIETIFNWPGIGRIGVEAIHTRDYPLLMGYNLFLATIMLVCSLATDIVYGFIDPRIRYR
jgi:peptide/nickel transport system permease protein